MWGTHPTQIQFYTPFLWHDGGGCFQLGTILLGITFYLGRDFFAVILLLTV